MLLTKNGMFLKCTQAYCHSNGTWDPVAMTMGYIVAMTTGYISNISRCHDDGIYLTPVAMTTGYIRYIHLWFPLISSVKVVYVYVIAWVAVAFGINCASNVGRKLVIVRGAVEHYYCFLSTLREQLIPNTMANHAITN